MGRVVLGGLIAGVVVFFWGAASHMALPIGTMGIRQIPNEDAVLAAFRGSITAPGFYFFPGMDHSKPISDSEKATVMAKIKEGPTGVLVIHPEGAEAMSPKQLGTELATNVVSALLAAGLLTYVTAKYIERVLFVTLLGVFGFLTVNVPYWNWYGFPADFIAAELIDQVVGWILAGLVLAAVVRPRKPNPT
jgi:hypothetical protein